MEMISAGAQFVFQALRADRGLPNDISRLRVKLTMTSPLIERAECWRFKFKVIDDLLPQLKDLQYEAQTMLNEFHYQELKERVQSTNRNFAGELVSSSLTNFRNWWSGYATKVKELYEKLENVYVTLKEACNDCGIPENPNQFSNTARPVTSSLVTEPKVFGRDEDLDKMIRLLGVPSGRNDGTGGRKRAKKEKGVDLAESSGVKKNDNVSVLPIVGIGGVGKTTLAQMVCNNKMVKSYFEQIIWVCVSDNFDVVRLTKEIIESATKESCDISNLNTLQVTLKDMLESKHFLLVLDDIWSEKRADWQSLFGPLKYGSEGSMIIVTTRSFKVAKITGTIIAGPIILEGLEEGVYWEFFKSCAFGIETDSKTYPELEEIGKEIVVKLKGSPLAAKTLGSLLNTDLDERHWRNIRDSEMWELQQEEHGILPVLQLSYQYLPSHLKKPFSFCSLFPKDHMFYKSQLMNLWICEGFIDLHQIQQMEVVANGYIRDLVSRCFFQHTPQPDEYVIHDLMHDVAQSITKDECFRIENEDFENKISENIRHVSIVSELKMNKLKKVHSIIFQNVSVPSFKAIEKWFNEFKNICSLSFARCEIKNLPENIGNLGHLRYLDISYTKIEELPNSFGNLYKLEYLNMEGCRVFKHFTKDSNRLISMKLLILPKHDGHSFGGNRYKISLVVHIPNLINAIQLENLEFQVEKEKDNTIGAIKHITRIYEKLMITDLDEVSGKEEAEQAQVNNKEFLNCLSLCWHDPFYTNRINCDPNHGQVLEGLCPHHKLKELEIKYYGGDVLPSWLKTEILDNLKRIRISGCYNITIMPCLPSSITILNIESCRRLTSVHDCLVPSNLPLLKELCIMDCGELVLLSVETFHEFVYLKELTIQKCPKLICPMERVLPTSLENLSVASCGMLEERLFYSLQNLTALTSLHIRECPNLTWPRETILPPSLKLLSLRYECGELEEGLSYSLQNLTSLTSLTIDRCPHLTSIQPHHICNLKSLEKLDVRYCNELQSLGGLKFFQSVKNIIILECPKLKETKGKSRIRGIS